MGLCRQEAKVIIRPRGPLPLLERRSRPFYTVPITKSRPAVTRYSRTLDLSLAETVSLFQAANDRRPEWVRPKIMDRRPMTVVMGAPLRRLAASR